MPTHGSKCDWCGQNKQAQADLREAMVVLHQIANMAESLCEPRQITDNARALLARLAERYPDE